MSEMSKDSHKLNGTFEYLPLESLSTGMGIFAYKKPSLVELEKSIREYGILQPLTVAGPFGPAGRYAVLDGTERVRAVKNINEKSSEKEIEILPCFILPLDTPEAFSLIWPVIQGRVTNDQKREYERFYMLFTLYKRLEKKLIDESKIKSIFQSTQGLKERAARSYKKVLFSTNKDLIGAVICDGKDPGKVHIKVELAEKIARLDRDTQKQIIDRANSGGNIEALLDEIRQSEQKEEN